MKMAEMVVVLAGEGTSSSGRIKELESENEISSEDTKTEDCPGTK